MDKFCKLWKKKEITSKNQNDAEKKRKLKLEEITEHVKKAKSTQKEQESTPKVKKSDISYQSGRLVDHGFHTMFKELCGAHYV